MLQTIIVGVIVTSAVLYFGFKMYKIFRRPGGSSGCGCDSNNCGSCDIFKKKIK